MPQSRHLPSALTSMLLLSPAGCSTAANFTNARTLGANNFEVVVEPMLYGASIDGDGLVAPNLGVSGRYGVSDRVDLGARLGGTGVAFISKFRLLDGGGDGLDMSLAPTLSGFFVSSGGDGGGIGTLSVPLLIGINTGDRNQLVLGPGLATTFGGFTNVGGATAIMATASLGYQAWLGKSVALQPEFGLLTPLAYLNDNADGSALGDFALWQLGVGFQFGSPERE